VVFCAVALTHIVIQSKISGVPRGTGKNIIDAVMIVLTLAITKVMFGLPAVFPLFWIVTSATGIGQLIATRSPNVKKLFRIRSQPTDSVYPWSKLFWKKE